LPINGIQCQKTEFYVIENAARNEGKWEIEKLCTYYIEMRYYP